MHAKLPEKWFCGPHMRIIDDNLCATILYLQTENGQMVVTPVEGV
jgi:hypothetical protein